MRHVSTRTAAVLIIAVAAALLAASPAVAADPTTDFTYTLGANSATITGYTGGHTVVDVPSVIIAGGVTYPVASIGSNAFRGNLLPAPLTSVIIPDTVIAIGDNAFRGDLLTSVVIPNSVTSIGTYAFYNNVLTSVALGDSLTTIGNNSFRGNSLTALAIPASVTSIGNYTFADNAAGANTLTSAIFAGAAPTTFTAFGVAGSFSTTSTIIYYYAGASGFTPVWNGYTARAISAATSDLTITPSGSVVADGVAHSAVTVTVRDDTHAVVVGVPIAFTVPAAVSASSANCTTLADGTCSISISSLAAATYAITANVGSDRDLLSQNISFLAIPDPAHSAEPSIPALANTGANTTMPLALGGSFLILGLALQIFRRKLLD